MKVKMIKKVLMVGLALVFSACNLPKTSSNSPDLVATEVSQILTLTQLIPSTATVEANAIPTLSITASASPTLQSTSTPTFTPTISLTNTNTPIPTDALIPSGDPTWKEVFNNGTSFGISTEGYDDGNTRIIIEDETLTLVSVNSTGWRGWRLASQKPANYFLTAVFKVETCSGSDQYGIITQSPDYENGYGYYFGLTCDGRYSIQKWNETGLTNLDGWNPSIEIQTGDSKENSVSILKSGENYKFFVNNVMVSQVNDNYFTNPGFFGPFIAGISTPNFTVRLQEIAYWLIQ
jgi:hypothetical protein